MNVSENNSSGTVHAHILDVATRLFARKGFEATSMREIAEQAGVAKPTIYYYFKSKEGLLEELLDASFSSVVEKLQEINARCPEADARECLVDGVWAVFEAAVERNDILRFIHSCVFGPAHQAASKIIAEDFSGIIEQFAAMMERAAGDGIVDPGRADQATRALRGVTDVYIVDYLMGWRGRLTRKDAEDAIRGLLDGYGAPRRAPH